MGRFQILVAAFLSVCMGLPVLAHATTATELEQVKEKYAAQNHIVVEEGKEERNQQVGIVQETVAPAVGNAVEQPQQQSANPHNAAAYNF